MVNRAELGALRDAIDTVLSWPDPVRDQIALWLQADASTPNGAGPGRPSRSRSNRHRGFKLGVEEAAARKRALLEAMRDHPEAGVVQWAKATGCDRSAVSTRLGRLATRALDVRLLWLETKAGAPVSLADRLIAGTVYSRRIGLRTVTDD